MGAPSYFKNIQLHLNRYVDLVEQSNSLGLGDETSFAENLFCSLLNRIFNWKLENANKRKPNQDSFDLIDKKRGIVVQVTSNKKHSDKQTKTIATFLRNNKNTKYNNLFILFISKKCADSVLKKAREKTFTYEGYDVLKLLKEIKYHETKVLKSLNETLQEALEPVITKTLNNKDTSGNSKNNITRQPLAKKRQGLVIDRNELVARMFAFGQGGNGLLIGIPGTGKSYTIEELQRLCYDKKVDCFIIRINELISCSDEELKKELNTSTYWIDALKKITPLAKEFKSLLIFDAFDTAKDELLKSAVLKQIKVAIRQLEGKYNILASARTFDATKSTRLLNLFPHVNINSAVSCRFFEIPILSEAELNAAVKTNNKLYSVVQKSTADLKNLLRTPYFLKLLERIVTDNKKLKSSSVVHIETEEQLLAEFWKSEASDSTAKDVMLQVLTKTLALNDHLSCSKDKIVTSSNTDVFDLLISRGIIVESSITKQNITFSHNILLEYAISRYLIPEEPELLVSFVAEHPKMAFHFRQSFIYFYSKLWTLDKTLFWNHYFLVQKENSPLFRLFHQTIMNYVLSHFYKKPVELSRIFTIQDSKERANIIRKILEGIKFTSRGNLKPRDFALLHRVTGIMHETFLWELGFLIDASLKQLNQTRDKKNIELIAKASCNYMRYVLRQRAVAGSKFLVEANGGHWGVLNLCKSFPANKPASLKLFSKLLDVLKEQEFPIRFFNLLSDNIAHLFRHDKRLAILIYNSMYDRVENSMKDTYLGNSVVMNLKSNRQQDYNAVHHRLEKEFKNILSLFPESAIPHGLAIVNKHCVDKRNYKPYERTFSFTVNGEKAKLTSDFNFFDSDREKEYGPLSHLENIFQLVENTISEGDTKSAIKQVNLIIKHGDASTVWVRLIKLLKQRVTALKSIAYTIVSTPEVLICTETSYDVGELIKVLWPLLSAAQKRKLERAILSIKSFKYVKRDGEFEKRKLSTLLNCIPFDNLMLEASKDFLNLNGKRESYPVITDPSFEPFERSEEEKMNDNGADPSKKEEVSVYEMIKQLEGLNNKAEYNKPAKPLKTEFIALAPTAKYLFEQSKLNSFNENAKLTASSDYEISRFAKLLVKHAGKLNKSLHAFAMEAALQYINSNEYQIKVYEKGGLKNARGAFTPGPRTNSVQTILNLLKSDKTGILAPLVLNLIRDNSQKVRFICLNGFTYFWLHHREDFWKKVNERCVLETDGMCLHQLMHSFCYTNIMAMNQGEVENAASLLVEKLKTTEEKVSDELWHQYTSLVIRLFMTTNSTVARSIIYANLGSKPFCRHLLLEIMNVISPHIKENKSGAAADKHANLFQMMMDIVAYRFASIKSKGLKADTIHDDFEVIDHCIQHLYFTLSERKAKTNGEELGLNEKIAFLNRIRSVMDLIVSESSKIDSGFMVASTGYYFMQILNYLIEADPAYILKLSSSVVVAAAANGFTYDQSTLGEIVKLTEKILADHKELLSGTEQFNHLITILDLFANSGWQEALELTWRLKEVF